MFMDVQKIRGASMLFLNNKKEILLLLRDDIPNIPFPNTWDILGGHMDENETPEKCIVREMKEEIGVDIGTPVLFRKTQLDDGIEYTFWKKADFDIEDINLHEGQKLQWFSEEEVKNTPDDKTYPGVKKIAAYFFEAKPFEN